MSLFERSYVTQLISQLFLKYFVFMYDSFDITRPSSPSI